MHVFLLVLRHRKFCQYFRESFAKILSLNIKSFQNFGTIFKIVWGKTGTFCQKFCQNFRQNCEENFVSTKFHQKRKLRNTNNITVTYRRLKNLKELGKFSETVFKCLRFLVKSTKNR